MKYGLAQAVVWVIAFLILAMLPAFIAYLGPAEPRTFWVEVGVGFGFVGLGLLALQFILTGRFRWVASSFGLDSMLQFHRRMGLVALGFVFAHPILLFGADPTFLEYLDPRVNVLRAMGLSAAMGALLLLVATSLWRLVFRLSYEMWRLVHGLLSIFILGMGVVHSLQVGHYVSDPWIQGAFILIGVGGVGTVVHTRVIRPWRLRATPYRVREVREERGDAWTLVMEPDGHPGMSFLPGQFCWITLGPTPLSLQQNPYSFSSSAMDAPGRVELTVKEEGDFSRSVREVEPGSPAFLQGPFGSFTPGADDSRGSVLIAGGVGVTPCMSMLRTFADRGDPRPLTLVYANVSREETIFLEELELLEDRLDLEVVHVFEEPPEGWSGEEGLIDKSLLERHIPEDRDGHDYFICGPAPMMNITETALLELGVSQRHIFSERFDMA